MLQPSVNADDATNSNKLVYLYLMSYNLYSGEPFQIARMYKQRFISTTKGNSPFSVGVTQLFGLYRAGVQYFEDKTYPPNPHSHYSSHD